MGTKPFEIIYPNLNITSLSFKPDDTYFVTGDRSGSLRQWSATNKLQVSLWAMKTREQIKSIVVSADGRWIVSCGTGNNVTIWSAVTQEWVREVGEHTGTVNALDISNDSTRFASGSADRTVRIFDIASGVRLIHPLQLDHGYGVVSVKFSLDASQIAIATDFYAGVYDTSSGRHMFGISNEIDVRITSFAWFPDGQKLLIASTGKIACIDPSKSQCSRVEWHIQVHDNPSGNYQQTLIVTRGKFIACSSGSSVSFWDYASRERIGQVINHPTTIICFAISHDGRRLACGHGSGITVHNLEGVIPEEYLPGILCLPLMQVSVAALRAWAQGNMTEAETILSNEIAQRSNPTDCLLAVRAILRTHQGEWRSALETTEMFLQIKPIPIGQIARSITLVAAGEQEAALDEFNLVFWGCDPCENQLLLVINSILMFVCDKRKQAISYLHRFVDACDEKLKDMYLQVLGMMYLKQGDYGNAVKTLGIVKNPFTTEDRGPLMSLFIIFNWNFENLKFIAWQRACERLYATGSVKEVGETLLKMVNPLPEDEKECAHGQLLQEIITRSGEVTLLAWIGKSSTCNSCLPSSPGVYARTLAVFPSRTLQGEALRHRTADLRAIVPLADALMTYGSVMRSQLVRFAHFRLLLPCIVFHVTSLRSEQENVHHAEAVGLGDVTFTTTDSLPLKQPRRLVFVNPWIDNLRESRKLRDEDGQEPGVELYTGPGGIADPDIGVEVVHEPMVEEVPSPPSPISDEDIHTRALELIARLGQSFSALLLLKQPDGAYKRIAADHEIIVRGIQDDTLRNLRIEVLEVV